MLKGTAERDGFHHNVFHTGMHHVKTGHFKGAHAMPVGIWRWKGLHIQLHGHLGGGGGGEEPRNSLGSVDAILSVCSHAGVCDIFKWRPSNSTPQRGEVFYGGDARWGLRKEEGVTPTPPHPTLACAGKALGGCKFHGLRLDVSEAWKARLSFRLRRGILSLQAASGF